MTKSAPITLDPQAWLKRAAELGGGSVSDFVATPARGTAEQSVEQAQVMRLSLEDQRAFVEDVLDPPEPSLSLRRAFRHHRALILPAR